MTRPATVSDFHIITGEYPPTIGGVADYTASVAHALAAGGANVHVWCPGAGAPVTESASGVTVRRALGTLDRRSLAAAGIALDACPAPRRILLQWVPHAFGFKSVNLGFCRWILQRARRHGDYVEVMVHEPGLGFREGGLRHDAVAALHRLMAAVLLQAATRVWVSIPAWVDRWRPFRFGRAVEFHWLPIPSTVPVLPDSAKRRDVRERFAPRGEALIGHFGSHGPQFLALWSALVPDLLSRCPSDQLMLLGAGSVRLREALVDRYPALRERIHAAGVLSVHELSPFIMACDVLVQPYPDGVSTRRSSAMAGLAHGVAVVTSVGFLSEDFWMGSGAAALAPSGDMPAMASAVHRLLDDAETRQEIAATGYALYEQRFALAHTISALLEAPPCASR